MTNILSTDDRNRYLQSVKRDMKEKVEKIKESFLMKPSGRESVQAYTKLIDGIIDSIYRTFFDDYFAKNRPAVPSLCLIAIGGYGRGELNINSDIDIMFLYEKKADHFVDHMVSTMLPLLWDIGLEIGHSSRSINDCLRITRTDIESLTALIESRAVAGDIKIYSKFCSVLRNFLKQRSVHRFIFQNIQERLNYDAENIQMTFASEPNIKESPGGLRDIHCALWAAKTMFSAGTLEELRSKNIMDSREYNSLESSINLILKIRNALHIFTGKKSDVLTHEVQRKITGILGYESDNEKSGIEILMKDYYAAAYNIHLLSNILIHRCFNYRKKFKNLFSLFRPKELGRGFIQYKDELSLKDFNEEAFVEEPNLLFVVFIHAQKYNLKLSENLKRIIRKNIPRIKDIEWNGKELKEFIFTLLKAKNTYKVLRAMNEIDVLGLLLPEFGKCKFQIHNDYFHMYSVDEHCLQAVEKLETLYDNNEGELSEVSTIYRNINKPEILKLSLLLHDAGKAEGQDHIKTGLVYSDNVIKRLNLDENDAAILTFLIKNHLLMNHVAQRRDLSDKNTIKEFAENVGEIELLRMLYVHTCADIMAVSPVMWTEWKGALLWELYHQTYDYLIVDDSVGLAEQEIANKCKNKVLSRLTHEIDKKFIIYYFDNMPVKYFASLNSDKIAKQLLLMNQLKDKVVAMEFSRDNKFGCWELMVCTKGKVGTLANITGILSSRFFNILSAQLYSGKDGIAIDTLRIAPSRPGYIDNEEIFKKVEKDMEDVLSGKKDISNIIKTSQFTKKGSMGNDILIPTTVLVDNDISETYTVFEIIFQDRLGSLYFLTKTFLDLGINITHAKISTDGKRGFDVFYVHDSNGEKILDEKKLKKIRLALMKSLGA